jgi:hypothetical protein
VLAARPVCNGTAAHSLGSDRSLSLAEYEINEPPRVLLLERLHSGCDTIAVGGWLFRNNSSEARIQSKVPPAVLSGQVLI